ncbi:hypothetical protein LTS15_002572 [Exophiala xenobiotica]|nr:hypothetical protein LTS15_002572 [Exophiala xenobiotica]
MASKSSPSDLLYQEADFIKHQAALIREVGNDIHTAAGMVQYRAYDFETRAVCLRKAAWDAKWVDELGTAAHEMIEEDQHRGAKLMEHADELMDAAQNVKIGLHKLVQIAYRSGILETTQVNECTDYGKEEHAADCWAMRDIAASSRPDLCAAVGSLTDLNTGSSLPATFVDPSLLTKNPINLSKPMQRWSVDTATTLIDSEDISMVLDDVTGGSLSRSTSMASASSCYDMETADDILEDTNTVESDTEPENEVEENDDEEILKWIPQKIDFSRLRFPFTPLRSLGL